MKNFKLCLGTAQFGLNYGINNQKGKISHEEIFELLNYAHNNGISTIDTASAYGNSEAVLGETITRLNKNFKITSKYPVNTEIRPFQWIDTSLERLKTEKVYGYLFHNFSIFREHPDYIDDFLKIKEEKKAEKTGFSLYYPSEAEYILKNNIPCDIIQIPYNIFDQRFACLFPDLKNKGIEIYARSVFLQGLFFIEPDKLDKRFDSVRKLIKKIHNTAKDNSVNIAALCLNFVNSNKNISYIIIGVDSVSNLEENISNYANLGALKISYPDFLQFALTDEDIILPFNWQK